MNQTKPTSKKRAGILIKAAMEALNEAGGSLPLRDIKREVEQRVTLTEEDRKVYEISGYVRWHSVLHFYSINCVKAGFIRKSRGQWWLTQEGKEVVSLSPDDIIDKATKAYRKWEADKQIEAFAADNKVEEKEVTEGEIKSVGSAFVLESAEDQAKSELQEFVRSLSPYVFQDLVAALLRGMGYTTPFVAPKGPDGGTDVLAYKDPLGTETPHIRAQVKHRKDKVTREEIAALRGVIRSEREVGLFVSTFGFTADAVREARQGTPHMELVDLDRFLDMWVTHYENLSEEDKGLLRLRRVYFLAPD